MASERQGWDLSFPEMTRPVAIGLYLVAIVIVVLAMDWAFRDRMVDRLLVRMGIVLVSAALYLRFIKRS